MDLKMGDYKKLWVWQEREDDYAIGYRLSAISYQLSVLRKWGTGFDDLMVG